MKIAFCADLHFGSVPDGLSDELRALIDAQKPDVVVIGGDLTLRARHREFEQAKAWLSAFRTQTLVLPGNHDLPYFNLIQRFRRPFHRFHKATGGSPLMPVVEGHGGLVLGFNTARSWQPHLRWQEGTARRRDIEAASSLLSAAGPNSFKAVVAHHPLMPVPGLPRARPVRHAERAIEVFAACGVELVMIGHIHKSYLVESEIAGRTILVVGAPTALSTRRRGEANGFWMIEVRERVLACTLWLRDETSFHAARTTTFPRHKLLKPAIEERPEPVR